MNPPFRADHVGSLLRPRELLQARESQQRGEITAAVLRAIEDCCNRDIATMQEDSASV
jgi:5-methyltetrahydropteroyltriglutamate--homocysteine methyltransferase